MRMLLTHKAIEINAKYPFEDSPICLATKKGDVDAVKFLVDQGDRLKINQLNRIDEETALCVAARNRRASSYCTPLARASEHRPQSAQSLG